MDSKFLLKRSYKSRLTNLRLVMLTLTLFTQVACKKLVETPIPTDQVAENAVYSNDATATAVLTSIYTAMNTGPMQGNTSAPSVGIVCGLAADEYSITTPFTNLLPLSKFFQNNLSQADPASISGAEHWAPFYNFIFKCNAAIAGLTSSQANSLTQSIRQQLLGEAKFVRAFCYFYLVNEFGDVPLVLTGDPQTNSNLGRSPKADIYQQMISDLLDAEEKLSNDYLDITLLNKTTERVRPTKWAAASLLARVYLYAGDYSHAEVKATEVINNTGLYGLLSNLNSVFLKNSKEAIWQIQPTDLNLNTREGQVLVIPSTGPFSGSTGNPVSLSKQLLNSFESNDKRKQKGNWVDTVIFQSSSSPVKYDTLPYIAKYKIAASSGVNSVGSLTEYFMVLRLAEQYLIRAEAEAHGIGGGISSAINDLNVIRNRAGLPNYSGATDQTSVLAAILHERQVELFGEWGHRWFDLKRTGNIDAVMTGTTPLKANGASWKSYQQWFPIPITDIQKSPNLTQNSGY